VPLDLPALWDLALANNPALREAAADVEAARGRFVQAGKYPNPRFVYTEDELGSNIGTTGTVSLQVTQEIVTAGKRKLARAAASRNLDVAQTALLGRNFDVLTRIRRAYFEYLGLYEIAKVHDEVVRTLEKSVEDFQELVKAGSVSETDLLRIKIVLDQARIARARNRTDLDAAWRQLAAEVGVPELRPPGVLEGIPESAPAWPRDAIVQRVRAANTDLQQARLEADQARLEFERARAEAVPNVQLGGGFVRTYIENTAGAIVSIETAIPAWDRKQGQIHEAQARWARARAAVDSASTRLSRETAEAYGRYQGTGEQIKQLTATVLPRLKDSLEQVQKGYVKGVRGITFADVQLALEALNDARLRLAETRRELWRAVADLQGLMQLDIDEDLCLEEIGHG
jgi:cobalt-zinc-cadmium efflux system outer membrane protein